MKEKKCFNREAISLLLYLEARSVDYGAKLDSRNLNATDRAILEDWTRSGFIKTGRISFYCIGANKAANQWVELSDEALEYVAAYRAERAKRSYAALAEIKARKD